MLVVIAAFCGILKAQSTSYLHNKKLGIYISKKNIYFSSYFYKIISSFILSRDTLDLQEEELKLALSIKLGEFLVPLLKQSFYSDSIYFINKYPLLARTFIKNYQERKISTYDFLKYLPYPTDYFILIDDLKLESEIERNVLSFSNQIFTTKRYLIKSNIVLVVVNLQERKVSKILSINYNSKDNTSIPKILKMNRSFENRGEELFYEIFNLAFWGLLTNK
ncbi:MAG: hypothetical protein RML72_05415 [Bacteroidia bacterium]|nr:hypothetical protein [Bacteroidia bacterium]MDW8158301.1 hypothetical protein [Bacteroidia bacterium]